jgi:hypothetical protein
MWDAGVLGARMLEPIALSVMAVSLCDSVAAKLRVRGGKAVAPRAQVGIRVGWR